MLEGQMSAVVVFGRGGAVADVRGGKCHRVRRLNDQMVPDKTRSYDGVKRWRCHVVETENVCCGLLGGLGAFQTPPLMSRRTIRIPDEGG